MIESGWNVPAEKAEQDPNTPSRVEADDCANHIGERTCGDANGLTKLKPLFESADSLFIDKIDQGFDHALRHGRRRSPPHDDARYANRAVNRSPPISLQVEGDEKVPRE